MPLAVELFLDPRAEERVRALWGALDAHGIPSLGSFPGPGPDPHVSLIGMEEGDRRALGDALAPVFAGHPAPPLTLTGLGFFLTPQVPAFLVVTPSAALLRLHRAVYEAVAPLVPAVGEYYLPDALIPHCTLALGATDRAGVADVVSRFPLPLAGRCAGAGLVEVPGGRMVARFACGSEEAANGAG